ncbi:MAG: hypothetical protein IKX65_01595 [Prevotella sp.]|nr:hypothetical protein [Prevotella sp.]
MKSLKIGGIRNFQLHPPHIGGGLVGVDVSFASFLCAKEKEGKNIIDKVKIKDVI